MKKYVLTISFIYSLSLLAGNNLGKGKGENTARFMSTTHTDKQLLKTLKTDSQENPVVFPSKIAEQLELSMRPAENMLHEHSSYVFVNGKIDPRFTYTNLHSVKLDNAGYFNFYPYYNNITCLAIRLFENQQSPISFEIRDETGKVYFNSGNTQNTNVENHFALMLDKFLDQGKTYQIIFKLQEGWEGFSFNY